jgi:hypothetical protein
MGILGRHVTLLRAVFALLVLAIFIASSAGIVFAAGGVYGTLDGSVVDADTRAPIAGATVTARSPTATYTATTNAKGSFTILGMSVDTYTVSISAANHEPKSLPGVVVFGDQANSVGTVALVHEVKVLGRVAVQSAASAFQPTHTTDSYTVSAQQILQSTGRAGSTNENAALLAIPGVTLTNNNTAFSSSVTIRGGAAAEVGYQYDGVPFKEPFLGGNGSNGLMSGVGTIQVVEGAGDATQGEVGAGVINVIPRRGSGPGSGVLNFTVGGPNYSHQFSFDYGFSTPNNRFSDYVTYNGERTAPYNGYHLTPLNQYGNYFATTNLMNDQFANNFFYKFGRNLNQQLQVLYTNIEQQGFGAAIGCGGRFDQATNPCALAYYPFDTLTQAPWIFFSGYTPQQYASLIGLGLGVPTQNVAITSPQQNFSNQTVYLKLEYDNNITQTTYVALRYYNWNAAQNLDDQYTLGPWGSGAPGLSAWQSVGGQTVGTNLDILHQLGSNLTVTLNGQYNVLYPEFTLYEPQLSIIGAAFGTGLLNQTTPADWLPGGYIFNAFCPGVTWTSGPRPSCLPRIPSWGINYNKTTFQNWGTGIRFQYNPIERLRFDLGVRDEGQIRHWFSQLDQFGQGVPSTGCSVQTLPCPPGASVPITNPYDVPASLWLTEPTALQPRGSISWKLGPNDAIRFAYGRSAVFSDAQTGGTPFQDWGLSPYMKIPAKPGSTCGWTSPAFGTQVFPCRSYGAQLYWQGDNLEAPDAENLPPAVYTNYDLSYNHLFTNGWGMRVTPFFKEGTSLPTFFLLNPVLGIFAISNKGFNKTTGGEFSLTTPERALGISGFFAVTYQNVLSTTPPFTTAETTVPLQSLASLQLGDIYRAGYVSPLSMRIGAVDKFKNGFSVSPQVEFNIGYPYSVGNLIEGCVSFAPTGVCLHYANVSQVDMGAGITSGQSSLVGGNPLASISTNYYDPSYPGSVSNPNIAATRGTPATSLNGGKLSHYNVLGNLTLEYKHDRNTFGAQFLNLFGNAWVNSVPAVNPWYQPVANGVSGPQTGINSCVNQTGANIRGCSPNIPINSYAFTNGAYLLSNGNFTGTPTFGPLQPFNVQFYFERSF